MANIPQRVSERLVTGIKKFKPVLAAAYDNKANESNTVIIITAMLSEVFGYDTFKEITSEIAIRGTFCDLATKIDEKIQSLIEAKAISQELKDIHVMQAVSYASNQGVDWVVLTNGMHWHIYKVTFAKPIDHEKIIEINFLDVDHHNIAHLEMLFRLTKEGWEKSALKDYYQQKQALSKFSIGAILSTDAVLNLIRKNLRLISPDAKINAEQIRSVLENEVITKEVLEGDKADEARRKIAKALKKLEKESEEETPTQMIQKAAENIPVTLPIAPAPPPA
ncbi:MAG TPA: type I restriction enzyme HsdR N-terminal domain-containing protein [Candidatus Sulfotelmatobacter sp.]|jgi:predicted type IV restriction endonuclease|nr:type I restriction enzyme HsdR N-terminal domain-containing protein [Candidatus Sulfotelmatobacter sp.]